ncbi:hypothetical protein R3P38DRAFT_2824667 [Favolaschia claudopus]|uniref:RNI-like protein n=1 Tax=Favolaschia claudopus TaxID=2862362 RepID=A0AAW0EI87_9AGAR
MSRKRARTQGREFGAPTEDDSPSAALTDSNSSALSTRSPRYTSVPPLTNLCSRIFADNFVRLRNKERLWNHVSEHLKALPDSLLPRLLADLIRVCPTFLKHEFLVTYFFRGPSLAFTGGSAGMPGVQTHTIRALDRMQDLRDLELSGFDKVPDAAFASVLSRLPGLKRLVLRGCTLVGPKAAAALKSCPKLQVLNLNYTAVTPISLQPVLLASGPSLEVLKLAGIPNWTDTTVGKMLSPDLSLPNLRTLKLTRLSISETSLHPLLAISPALRRLDIGFTTVRHPLSASDDAQPIPALEKLSLTSTHTSNADLLALLPHLPGLKTLALGALGASPRSIAAIDSSMTLTDTVLLKVIPVLQSCTALQSVSLVGNIKLKDSLSFFVTEVGRRCKYLNLSGLPAMRSWHLAGLPGDQPPRLETLMLNHTNIDDEAAPFLAACPDLAWLEVAETKMTSDGLFLVLDGCPKISTLGLRSCRGVRVGDRRRFFEAWEEDRAGT